jgi:transcriptional regulator with XRE-family HTH domain
MVTVSASLRKEQAMQIRAFGVRLTQFRERAGLSVTQLAKHSGIDYMQISRYETGRTLPSLDSAIRLATVFRVSLDELVTGTEPPAPPAPAAPPAFQNEKLFERMRELDRLPPDRQDIAIRLLDTVISGHELEDLSQRLRRDKN